MECIQLYNVHHNVEIVYNISTLFVLGEVHNVHRDKSFYQLLHCLLILQLVAAAAANSSSVYSGSYYTGNQNRNFLQLQNHYPMMT